MAWATPGGKPAAAPLIDTSTIFHGLSKPASTTPMIDQIVTGLTVHTGLSFLYGIGFALLIGLFAGVLRSPPARPPTG